MKKWNLATEEGLREACAQLNERIDEEHREHLARVTAFLEEVAVVSQGERASGDFQERIWLRNPIARTVWRVPATALENAELRRWFADRTNAELPTDWKLRSVALADIFWETVDRPGFIQGTGRPRRHTLRTLAALFPEHLTGAIAEDRLSALQFRMGSSPLYAAGVQGIERECRDQLLYSSWIRHRLDEVLGKPETMAGHARRLLLSGELAELASGQSETEGEGTEPEAERQQAKREPADSGPEDRQMNVWLFRAGRDGEDEDAWLDGNLAFLGFQEVGDLTACGSQDDVREQVAAAYQDSDAGTITKHATELRQFAVDSELGDFVVMPRKYQPTVAVGRIAGHYGYAEVDGLRRHTRAVHWERADGSEPTSAEISSAPTWQSTSGARSAGSEGRRWEAGLRRFSAGKPRNALIPCPRPVGGRASRSCPADSLGCSRSSTTFAITPASRTSWTTFEPNIRNIRSARSRASSAK